MNLAKLPYLAYLLIGSFIALPLCHHNNEISKVDSLIYLLFVHLWIPLNRYITMCVKEDD